MLGERLRLAREAVGLRQTDAARHLGIADSGISEMESGVREPKASQLALLAQLYTRPLDFFFSEEPAVPDVVLWRARPADEGAAKRLEREFLSLCEDYHELENLTGTGSPSSLPEDLIPREQFGYQQAEFLATRLWREWELGALPADTLRPILEEKHHVRIFALALGGQGSAASARSPRFGSAVLLNGNSVPWRRNFDLAHELFHLLTWATFRRSGEQLSLEAGEDEESLANVFASRLLLPEGPFAASLQPFLDKAGSLRITVAQIHDLARGFDVSTDAVIYRCAGLFRWRKEETQRLIGDVRAFRVWRERRPARSLPSRYVHLVLQAHRSGLISFQRAARYLRKTFRQAQNILEQPADVCEPDREIEITPG